MWRADTVPTMVLPATLSVTHVFDGQELVMGGDDGQVWVATFASQRVARAFIAWRMQDPSTPILGERGALHGR